MYVNLFRSSFSVRVSSFNSEMMLSAPFIDLCWLFLFNHLQSLGPSTGFRDARLIIRQVSARLDASPPLLCRAWWRLYWPDYLWSRQHGCEQLSCLIKEARKRETKGLSLLILLSSASMGGGYWKRIIFHFITYMIHKCGVESSCYLLGMMMTTITMIENKTGCLSFKHQDTSEIKTFPLRINYMQLLMTQFCGNYCSNYSCRKWENV